MERQRRLTRVWAGLSGAVAFASIGVAPPAGSQAPNPADTAVEIEIRSEPGASVARFTLTCDPLGGTVPDPASACQRIAALVAEAAAAPPIPVVTVRPDGSAHGSGSGVSRGAGACTAIYGGPEVARITGRFRGQAVDDHLTRVNGCEMARYDKTMRLFGVP